MLAAALGWCAIAAANSAANGHAAATGGFVASGGPHTFKNAPGVYEYVFSARRGPSPFDTIALHRITRGPSPAAHHAIVMLYLPGTNMNGEVAIDSERFSMPLYMAAHGVDFWALDYRTHFVPPSTPPNRLRELRGWTNQLFESDIDAAARFVMARTGRDRIFVSGFSRGVSFAYLYAAEHPRRVAGLVMFDGWNGHGRPGSPPRDLFAEDVSGKHLTWDKRQALLRIVIDNPDAPAPIAGFANAGDNLAHVVYDSRSFGGKGGLSNPFGGFANVRVLARVLFRFDRYWPIAQDYEDSFTTPLLESLRGSRIPVLAFSSTNIAPGWPRRVAASASETGSGDVTVVKLESWGHLDVICGTQARERVFEPAARWLMRHRTRADIQAYRGGAV
ncbi:MAG TPA: hypothetical protein VJ718_11165 [Candidatus Binataceae bacterium]|nr:hypothetical protein [Candidatus Binataceae bacterium]